MLQAVRQSYNDFNQVAKENSVRGVICNGVKYGVAAGATGAALTGLFLTALYGDCLVNKCDGGVGEAFVFTLLFGGVAGAHLVAGAFVAGATARVFARAT